MNDKKEKFVIIDGNAIVHRAWHALPPTLRTKSGQIVNAVYGFTSILLKVIKDLKPDFLAVTFDLRGPTFRHKEYAEYKATREKKPDELYEQIPIIKEVVRAFRIPILEKEGFEADDVIATIVNRVHGQMSHVKCIIVTGDMDAFQLIGDQTEVYAMHKGISDTLTYDQERIKQRFGGLTPEQLVDLKALRGDPSDNIPGVKGIGEKTAIELLREFHSLENLYARLGSPTIKERYRKLLEEQKNLAFLSKKLVMLRSDVPLDTSVEKCRVVPMHIGEIVPLFQKLEFKSLLGRLPRQEASTSEKQPSLQWAPNISGKEIRRPKILEDGKAQYGAITSEKQFSEFLKKLKTKKFFSLDTETDSVYPTEAKLVALGIGWKEGEAYCIPKNSAWLVQLKPILENPKIKKIGQNIKFDIEVLAGEGIRVRGELFDTMVAAYLLHPGMRQYGLDNLVFSEFGYQMQPIEDLIGKKGKDQKTMNQIPFQQVSDYCCEDVDFTLRLVEPLKRQLEETNNVGLFEKMEMPLIYVLAEVEKNGVCIDIPFLHLMKKSLRKKIALAEEKIHSLAGQKFNIASPLQLKEVLFDVLNISTEGLHKTKTGVSSAAAELEKLKDKHPIISLIMEYRELTKLLTTYVDALPKLVSAIDGRVHTSFNQTIAATGRLSSSDPNLQNIPVRTELGQEIRKAFIAERGHVLVAADYSQIELRIIASLANDEKMIEGFLRGEDIHTRTAAEIAGIPQSEVTPKMRRAAKAINFGIIYGMGPYGLAMREGISSREAKEFIDKYFNLHSSIKKYIEEIIETAKKFGFVETWYGRRRYFPEINSTVQPMRASAERMAVNHPIQGTAADLMKLAMIEIHKKLPKVSKNSKMILQVHDELIFECPEDEARKVAQLVKKEMEGVYKLRAPIGVKVETGKNWGELKELEFQ